MILAALNPLDTNHTYVCGKYRSSLRIQPPLIAPGHRGAFRERETPLGGRERWEAAVLASQYRSCFYVLPIVTPGAIIRDGDRNEMPFWFTGLSPQTIYRPKYTEKIKIKLCSQGTGPKWIRPYPGTDHFCSHGTVPLINVCPHGTGLLLFGTESK